MCLRIRHVLSVWKRELALNLSVGESVRGKERVSQVRMRCFVRVVESICRTPRYPTRGMERHGSGISLFFQCFPDMTITFASIQMVKQNVEETDTSKIITKISCDRVDYE